MPESATPEELLGPLNAAEKKNAPAALFYAGEKELLRRHRVAIVGRRDTSEEGARRAARLAHELVAAEVQDHRRPGVSQATVIVEANERSGTVSQGWEAIRLGRPLYFLRSLVENPDLTRPKLMLDYGAEVLDTTEQLLVDLPPRPELQFAEAAF